MVSIKLQELSPDTIWPQRPNLDLSVLDALQRSPIHQIFNATTKLSIIRKHLAVTSARKLSKVFTTCVIIRNENTTKSPLVLARVATKISTTDLLWLGIEKNVRKMPLRDLLFIIFLAFLCFKYVCF